jgi:O-antigen ligase
VSPRLLRYAGKLKESARISGLFAYVAPFFIGWAASDKTMASKHRIFIAGVGVLALVLVLQTHIRTAFLASGAGIAISSAYLIYKKSRWAIIITELFFAGFLLIDMVRIPSFNDLNSIHDRIYIWKVASAMWLEHPIFGVGVASFKEVYKSVAASGIVAPFIAADGNIFREPEAMHAHNLFLMLLACGGIVGFSMFSWLFINLMRLACLRPAGWRFGLVSWPVVACLLD